MTNKPYVPLIVSALKSEDFSIRIVEKVPIRNNNYKKIIDRYKQILSDIFEVTIENEPLIKLSSIPIEYDVGNNEQFVVKLTLDGRKKYTKNTEETTDSQYLDILFKATDMEKFKRYIVSNEDDYWIANAKIKKKK